MTFSHIRHTFESSGENIPSQFLKCENSFPYRKTIAGPLTSQKTRTICKKKIPWFFVFFFLCKISIITERAFLTSQACHNNLCPFLETKTFFWKLPLLWFGTNCEGAEKTSFQTLFLFQLLLLWVVGVDNFENKKESLSCLFFLYLHRVWNHRKSLIQHCERS